MSFKVKQRVSFKARVAKGEGRIVQINTTTRGLWYVVRADATGKEIKLRAAAITLL